MREVDDTSEFGTVPIDSTETPAVEGSPTCPDDVPLLELIERLSEEDTSGAPKDTIESPSNDGADSVATVRGGVEPLKEAVKALGEQLARRLDSLQAILEREQRAEASRERVVDRLHTELQEYKQDLLLKVQRPIFIDLIQLHDDIGKMIEARAPAEAEAEAEPERGPALRGILESIQTAIEDILYRQAVEPFSVEGTAFDPRKQRAVSTVATEDSGRNKTIAARLRKGFQAGDKLIRPEIVSVYTVRPATVPKPASEPLAGS